MYLSNVMDTWSFLFYSLVVNVMQRDSIPSEVDYETRQGVYSICLQLARFNTTLDEYSLAVVCTVETVLTKLFLQVPSSRPEYARTSGRRCQQGW